MGDEASDLAKLCGSQLPSMIETDANKATIIFSSDEAVTDSGFKINWEAFQVGN